MSETEDSGNTGSRKRDRSLSLSKKRRRIADTTEGEVPEPGPAVMNSQSVVGPIMSTSSDFQRFQRPDYSRSPSDVLMAVRKVRHK